MVDLSYTDNTSIAAPAQALWRRPYHLCFHAIPLAFPLSPITDVPSAMASFGRLGIRADRVTPGSAPLGRSTDGYRPLRPPVANTGASHLRIWKESGLSGMSDYAVRPHASSGGATTGRRSADDGPEQHSPTATEDLMTPEEAIQKLFHAAGSGMVNDAEAALAAAQVERQDSIALNASTKVALGQQGSIITTLSPFASAQFKTRTAPVYAQFAPTFGESLIQALVGQ